MTGKQPTPQGISALLRKAGFARSRKTRGRTKWDGTIARNSRINEPGYQVRADSGHVCVRYSAGRVVNPAATDERRRQALLRYSDTIAQAGYLVHASSDGSCLIVTAPESTEGSGDHDHDQAR